MVLGPTSGQVLSYCSPHRHNLSCICLTVCLQVRGGCCAGAAHGAWPHLRAGAELVFASSPQPELYLPHCVVAGARRLLRWEQRMVLGPTSGQVLSHCSPHRHNLSCICLTVWLQVRDGCCAGSSAWCWAPPPARW
jgi:hypothetical protein